MVRCKLDDGTGVAGNWNGIQGRPYPLVTPNGPTDGGDFGPNTPSTVTNGIAEAMAASLASQVGNANAVITVRIAPGDYPVISHNIAIPNPASSGFADNVVGLDIGGFGGRANGPTINLKVGSKGFTFPAYTFYNSTFHDFHIANTNGSEAASAFDRTAGPYGAILEQEDFLERMLFDCGSSGFTTALYNNPGTSNLVIDLRINNCIQTGNGPVVVNVGGTIYSEGNQWGSSATAAVSFNTRSFYQVHDWVNESLAYLGASADTWSLIGCIFSGITTAAALDISGATASPRIVSLGNRYIYTATTGTSYLIAGGTQNPYLKSLGNLIYTSGSAFQWASGSGTFAVNSWSDGDEFNNVTLGGWGLGVTQPSSPGSTSGSTYQNTYGRAMDLYVPVSFAASTASTFVAAIGPTSSPAITAVNDTEPLAITGARTQTYRIKVPAGWYYKLTVTGAGTTIGAAVPVLA